MLHAFPHQPKEVHTSRILSPNKSTYNLKIIGRYYIPVIMNILIYVYMCRYTQYSHIFIHICLFGPKNYVNGLTTEMHF